MTRTTKKWVGIALPFIIVLFLLIRQRLAHTPLRSDLHRKYQSTRIQISRQLMNLRHEFGTKQMHYSQNTSLEIRRLWDERDMLYHSINGKKDIFQSDSLARLEQLIDSRAPLTTVLREIGRIEKINDTY
ncbi:MAG: hypothetical protein J7619_09825 [Dyadobacter sp.]|uniref:hypothetical protein n=1 Tax=Dyadobacter sp. TaxID=1914288 RepID=UPI001B157E74|nr:hypothetical protein [Dyadobacter sp.]MBO9612983.1 hypothetical protein [Dyadobacter sp.]